MNCEKIIIKVMKLIRNSSLIYIAILLISFIVIPIAYAESNVPIYYINSCSRNITEDGLYILTQDIHFDGRIPGWCMGIENYGNLIFDCRGHQIINDYPENTSVRGIDVQAAKNMVIKNCHIKNTFQAISVASLERGSDVKIINNKLEKNYYSITLGDWTGTYILDKVDLIGNSISGNTLPETHGHGCPITVNNTLNINFLDNKICGDIDPAPCFYGPLVYCDSNSSVYDQGNNKIIYGSTNCHIRPETCPITLDGSCDKSLISDDNNKADNLPLNTIY